MQQRLRVAAGTITRNLAMAGAGSYLGGQSVPLVYAFPPVLPFRQGAIGADPPGTFRADAVTLVSVPATPAQTTLRAEPGAGRPDTAGRLPTELSGRHQPLWLRGGLDAAPVRRHRQLRDPHGGRRGRRRYGDRGRIAPAGFLVDDVQGRRQGRRSAARHLLPEGRCGHADHSVDALRRLGEPWRPGRRSRRRAPFRLLRGAARSGADGVGFDLRSSPAAHRRPHIRVSGWRELPVRRRRRHGASVRADPGAWVLATRSRR